jgi:hypothetical protein
VANVFAFSAMFEKDQLVGQLRGARRAKAAQGGQVWGTLAFG